MVPARVLRFILERGTPAAELHTCCAGTFTLSLLRLRLLASLNLFFRCLHVPAAALMRLIQVLVRLMLSSACIVSNSLLVFAIVHMIS